MDERLIQQFQDIATVRGPQWEARLHSAMQQVTFDFARRGLAASSGHASGRVDAAKAEMFARIAEMKDATKNLPALSESAALSADDLQEAFQIVASGRTRIDPNSYRAQLQAMGMLNFNGDPTQRAQAEVDAHIAAALGEIGALAHAHADKVEKREIELRSAIAANAQASAQGNSVKVQRWSTWMMVGSNFVSAILGSLFGYWLGKH